MHYEQYTHAEHDGTVKKGEKKFSKKKHTSRIHRRNRLFRIDYTRPIVS